MSLALQKISKFYGKTTACQLIELTIKQGEFFFILGPSGCGKSTLLKIIAGLLKQDSGSIVFNGISYDEIPAYERPFNMVFQNYSLFPHLNVFDNIAFGLKMNNIKKGEINARVKEVLLQFKISELAQQKPEQLSGGQQQRVALARAIVNKPKILLLDEPLSALDEKLRVEMQQTLKELKTSLNTTFIYVTHNQEEALSMGDRIAVMNNGKIEQVSSPRDIYHVPLTKFVAEFMGEINILNYKTEYFEDSTDKSILFDNEEAFLEFNPKNIKNKTVQLIRPENIHISKGHTSNQSFYDEIKKGTIIQLIFKGNTITYIVKCDNGNEIKVTNFNTDIIENLLIGNEVCIRWQHISVKNVRI